MSGPVRIQEQNRKMKHTRASNTAVHLYLQTSLRLLIESFIIKAFAFGARSQAFALVAPRSYIFSFSFVTFNFIASSKTGISTVLEHPRAPQKT